MTRRVTPMVRMSTIIIAVILGAATAKAQNYPPFLHEAEQALVNEFWKLEQQDWQEWRQQQERRLRRADDEDDATCWRLQGKLPVQRLPRKASGHTAGVRTGWRLLRQRLRLI